MRNAILDVLGQLAVGQLEPIGLEHWVPSEVEGSSGRDDGACSATHEHEGFCGGGQTQGEHTLCICRLIGICR